MCWRLSRPDGERKAAGLAAENSLYADRVAQRKSGGHSPCVGGSNPLVVETSGAPVPTGTDVPGAVGYPGLAQWLGIRFGSGTGVFDSPDPDEGRTQARRATLAARCQRQGDPEGRRQALQASPRGGGTRILHSGDVAQSGVRSVRIREVAGAEPAVSTKGVLAHSGERRDGIAEAAGAEPADSTFGSRSGTALASKAG